MMDIKEIAKEQNAAVPQFVTVEVLEDILVNRASIAQGVIRKCVFALLRIDYRILEQQQLDIQQVGLLEKT